MLASRSLDDLHPDLKPLCQEFLDQTTSAGIDVIITCTYRSNAEQDALFTKGRTAPGLRVTNARGGMSAHNFMIDGKPAARAFDVCPIVNGKCQWDATAPEWKILGNIGMSLGLNWYGEPHSLFYELPHFQLKTP